MKKTICMAPLSQQFSPALASPSDITQGKVIHTQNPREESEFIYELIATWQEGAEDSEEEKEE